MSGEDTKRLAEIRRRQDLRRLNHKVFNGSTEALDDIDYLLSLVDETRAELQNAKDYIAESDRACQKALKDLGLTWIHLGIPTTCERLAQEVDTARQQGAESERHSVWVEAIEVASKAYTIAGPTASMGYESRASFNSGVRAVVDDLEAARDSATPLPMVTPQEQQCPTCKHDGQLLDSEGRCMEFDETLIKHCFCKCTPSPIEEQDGTKEHDQESG